MNHYQLTSGELKGYSDSIQKSGYSDSDFSYQIVDTNKGKEIIITRQSTQVKKTYGYRLDHSIAQPTWNIIVSGRFN